MSKAEFDLIDQKLIGLAELVNAHFHNVDDRLGKIETQTTKTNGRVTDLEKKELTHIIDCPQAPKIRILEDNQLSNKSVKKWIITSVGVAASITGIVFIFLKIFFGV